MSDAARIEEFFASRYDRAALYLPSGRLALYLAFQEWLEPGDRMLMSPVDDDVVFFTVLAAGLVPVLGPLDPATGNLDPDGLDEATLRGLKAVMTTNLYGIPDRMDRWVELCAQFGLLLIEDACQALDSRYLGRRVGTFSPVAAFSLTKHIDGTGGVLTFTDVSRRSSLVRAAQAALRVPTLMESTRRSMRARVRQAIQATRMLPVMRRARHALLPKVEERHGHRMEYQEREVLEALKAGGGLDRFDRWVRVDNANYRTVVAARDQRRTLSQLLAFEETRQLRQEGARILMGLGLTPLEVRIPENMALFKVPLFIHDRERVLREVQGQDLPLDYIYDPPLDRYVTPAMADSLPSPASAIRWSRDVLPVNPLHAKRFAKMLEKLPSLSPAPESVAS
jgi:hypothetical protein